MSLICWNKVVTGYDNDPLHSAFTGHMEEPGIYAIIGPNGSGKTSFLKASLGLIKPISGHIRIGEKELNYNSKLFIPPFPVSYVPQLHQINPYYRITVKELVTLPPNTQEKNGGKTFTRLGFKRYTAQEFS